MYDMVKGSDLKVSGIELTRNVISHLLEFLDKNPKIHHLSLTEVNIDSQGIKRIASAYTEMLYIRSFEIVSTPLNEEHLRALYPMVIYNLSLKNCGINDQGAEILANAYHVRNLDLPFNNISPEGQKALEASLFLDTINGLGINFYDTPNGKTLEIIDAGLTSKDIKDLVKFLKKNPEINTLSFEKTEIKDWLLEKILTYNIRDIKIKDTVLNDEHFKALAKSSISSLDLSGIELKGKADYLVQSEHLKKLTVHNCGLTNEDVVVLAKSSLEFVDLTDNPITLLGALALAKNPLLQVVLGNELDQIVEDYRYVQQAFAGEALLQESSVTELVNGFYSFKIEDSNTVGEVNMEVTE